MAVIEIGIAEIDTSGAQAVFIEPSGVLECGFGLVEATFDRHNDLIGFLIITAAGRAAAYTGSAQNSALRIGFRSSSLSKRCQM